MNLKNIDLKGILEGVSNSIFVKKWVEDVASERFNICKECEFFSENAKFRGYTTSRVDNHCIECGCNLHLKTRCMDCYCPLTPQKWEKVLSESEWESLKKQHKL